MTPPSAAFTFDVGDRFHGEDGLATVWRVHACLWTTATADGGGEGEPDPTPAERRVYELRPPDESFSLHVAEPMLADEYEPVDGGATGETDTDAGESDGVEA